MIELSLGMFCVVASWVASSSATAITRYSGRYFSLIAVYYIRRGDEYEYQS
jgi:hypothetical protein